MKVVVAVRAYTAARLAVLWTAVQPCLQATWIACLRPIDLLSICTDLRSALQIPPNFFAYSTSLRTGATDTVRLNLEVVVWATERFV